MADYVEPIPQVAIGDLAGVADRYLAAAGDATLMLLSCDNWVHLVRESGYTNFHAFMDRAIRVAAKHAPPRSTVLRLESDQFGIVCSGLSNREGRALAMRIQMLVVGAAEEDTEPPVISVAVGHILPGRATSLEVITRAKDMLKESYSAGTVVSVSSAPLAEPWDDFDTKPIPPVRAAAPLPLQAMPIVRIGPREVVAFELIGRDQADLHDLTTALEIGQSLAGGLNVHVNIPCSWVTHGMMEEVLRILGEGPSNAFQVCVELSAKGFAQQGARFGQFVYALRAMGCMVALDDVGYGATTIEQVVEIEPDIVKFDPDVLKGLRGPRRARSARIIDAFADGKRLLVGLGVEHDTDEQLLVNTGIHIAQGPLYGPPTR